MSKPLEEIRRSSHLPLQFTVECEARSDGMRCLVEFVGPNPALAPIFRHTMAAQDHLSEHPTVRVYDEFLSDPSANAFSVGKVTHICIVGLDSIAIRHLVSVVETKTNVMLFPAWGKNAMRLLQGMPSQPEVPVGHVTWNKRGQQIHLHRSGGARHGSKKKSVGTSTQLRADQGGHHAARLGVRTLIKLDRTGLAVLDVPSPCLGNRTVADIQAALQESLKGKSVAARLPPEWGMNMEGRHLEVCFGMKTGPFQNEELPRPARPFPIASRVEQVLKVPLSEPWNLLIQFRLVDVPAAADFTWATG